MRKCDEAKGELYQEQEINFLPELPRRIDKGSARSMGKLSNATQSH